MSAIQGHGIRAGHHPHDVYATCKKNSAWLERRDHAEFSQLHYTPRWDAENRRTDEGPSTGFRMPA